MLLALKTIAKPNTKVMFHKDTIISEIKKFMNRCGGYADQWYVSLSAHPKKTLFNRHGVNERKGDWLFIKAQSGKDAQEVEKYFVNNIGTDGKTTERLYIPKYIYLYKKSLFTNQ